MQVFCKKTLHIITADCRKGNACITVFPELRKEFQRGAGTPSESPIRFVNFAALELIQG